MRFSCPAIFRTFATPVFIVSEVTLADTRYSTPEESQRIWNLRISVSKEIGSRGGMQNLFVRRTCAHRSEGR